MLRYPFLKHWQAMICVIGCLCISQGLASAQFRVMKFDNTRGKLLEKQALKDCDLHVIGIDQPAHAPDDERVIIDVTTTKSPCVLVLMSQQSVHWVLRPVKGAKIRQIVLSGAGGSWGARVHSSARCRPGA